MTLADRLSAWAGLAKDRLAAWDRRVARSALRDFERAYGLDLRAPRVVLADVDTVHRALAPEDRPLVEHHWSTKVAASVDGLARLGRIAGQVHERADVVGVAWDLVDAAAGVSPGAVRHHVEQVCEEHRASWPILVVEGGREALLESLRLPYEAALPLTRVLDRDGGVLRTFPGPLTDADVDAVLALVGA